MTNTISFLSELMVYFFAVHQAYGDHCDRWYYQHCMGMSEGVYQGLKNVTWECFSCGIPNFCLGLFDTTIFETSITFSYLSETTSSDLSFSNPIATSSPSKVTPRREDLPMRVLILNTQSIESPGKPAQLQTLIPVVHQC